MNGDQNMKRVWNIILIYFLSSKECATPIILHFRRKQFLLTKSREKLLGQTIMQIIYVKSCIYKLQITTIILNVGGRSIKANDKNAPFLVQ